MNPEIYSSYEISLIQSLMVKFRGVISNDEDLYGFSLSEFDEVHGDFPDVDIYDEGANSVDHSYIVLNNMFAFLLDNNPKKLLSPHEITEVTNLWDKLEKCITNRSSVRSAILRHLN